MRFLKFLFFLCCISAVFSCKKNSSSFTATPNFYFVNGDSGNVSKNLLLFGSSDTLTYSLVISSTFFLSSSALVTVAPADEYRTNYNTASGHNYQAMPANAYTLQDTVTATASSLYDTITLKVYKNQLGLSLQYMLPVKIITAGSYSIDTSSSVIYLSTTNNTVSGVYNSTGTKIIYNGDAADSNVNSTDSFTLTKNLVPETQFISLLDYADLGANGWKYSLYYNEDDNVFTVTANDVILNSVQSGSFQVLSSSFDAATSKIYIKTSYKNLSGDERIVEESLTLQ